MPKVFGKEMPMSYIAGATLVVVVLVYTQLFPAAEPPRGVSKKTVKKTTAKNEIYQPEDYTIKFVSNPDNGVKNSFKPLIVRKTGVAGAVGSPSGEFTGGEAGWIYTGSATVNGTAQGLLENRVTGDSEFVTTGQHWKTSTIASISGDALVLNGPSGDIFRMVIGDPTEPKPNSGVNAANGAPVTVPPGMVGPIGANDLNIQPMQNDNGNNNNNGNNGNGGNGRRRRGRPNNNNQ
ncbi:hypothetical protein BH11ARM1_BH11ARM1_12070 [soil metagenome]